MTSKWCRDKGVVVAVYSEKPPEQGGRHHHHHHYHKNVSRVRGYNRRAELLDYARHLRAPAQSHPSSHIKQLPTTQVLAADDGTRKQKRSTSPTCFDKWSFVVTRFLRSMTALETTKDKEKRNHKNNVSTTANMKALVKNLQKKGIFFSELLTARKKRR